MAGQRMPVGMIHPIWLAKSSSANSKIENPTRNASARTVRLLLPLSFIRNTNAETRLPIISRKARATSIFMDAKVNKMKQTKQYSAVIAWLDDLIL